MTINQLHYVLMLNKHRNFKRAAEHLEISQPGLSLQVQKLEEEVGFKLFNRTTNPVELTEDGKLFLTKAQEVIVGMRQLQNFSTEIREDFSGKLTIGMIPTLAPFLVPLFVGAIEKAYPKLQLIIKERITEHVIDDVRNGTLDAGIISTPIHAHGIQAFPLFYERFYVYSSDENHKKDYTPEEISKAHLWMLDEGNCFRDQINNFCDLKRIRKGKNFIYQSNSIDALMRIVETKGGMTILPELSTLSLNGDQEENLKEISGPPKVREIGLIVPNKYDKERYIQALKTHILDNIPNHMKNLGTYEIVDPNITIK